MINCSILYKYLIYNWFREFLIAFIKLILQELSIKNSPGKVVIKPAVGRSKILSVPYQRLSFCVAGCTLTRRLYEKVNQEDISPEFWPEPWILTVQVGVHLHVIAEVEHLVLETQLPVLDDDNSLQ